MKYLLIVERDKRPTVAVITINWNHNEVVISQAVFFFLSKIREMTIIKYFRSDYSCIMYFGNTNQDLQKVPNFLSIFPSSKGFNNLKY